MESRGVIKLAQSILGIAVRSLFALPDRLMALIFGTPPAEAAALRPDAWAMGRVIGLIEDRRTDWDPEEAREETDFLAGAVSLAVPEVISQDWVLEDGQRGLPARLFIPESNPLAGPMLLHFHGGGWVQ
ncbi:MAG TPA: hypothetical protein P5138_07870, partial [Solirubrobacterales bacterium]|nr:hypothetical protein [Solirubrobacterales bacterium]